MECRYCKGVCIKKGIRNGIQSYQCKFCKKYQKGSYKYNSYTISDELIKSCVKEGLGIRSIARLLEISPTTVITRIVRIGKHVLKPPIPHGKSYEVDELFTFIGNKRKRVCVVIALERSTKLPVDFYVGSRSLKSLRMVINTLLISMPASIHTDKLNLYKYLIPDNIHRYERYGTNGVERLNLTLRTHLKRLNRRSIAYSKSMKLLRCCLAIYFWG